VRDHPGTTLEFIPAAGGPVDDHIVDVITRMSLAANRPLNWNVLVMNANEPEIHERKLRASDLAAEQGAKVVALTTPDLIRFRISFLSGFVLDAFPDWPHTMTLPAEEKLRALADPDHRRHLDAAAHSPEAGDRIRLADWASMRVAETFSPETNRYKGWTVGQVAVAEGKSAFDAMCDLVVADRLRTSFAPPPVGDDDATWRLRAEMWSDERVVLGASDAGAHVESISTFNYATSLLGESVRGRRLLSLEEAVRLLTDVPARLYGLRGRGRIAEGNVADMVLFDETTVDPGAVETRWDLPADAPRLYSEPHGVEHVFVNGTEIVHRNQLTGVRPGTLLRSGVHTSTVTVPGG
jgi:N-acyl-D-aspartate/D-glutamate deacylase